MSFGKSVDEFSYNNDFDQSIIKSDKILPGFIGVRHFDSQCKSNLTLNLRAL